MTAPRRIVSLVPSLTETLVHFGLLDRLVGRTRYCVEPHGTIESVETVGGTKNPDVARIVALAPDVVVVNKEENRREDAEALRDAGLSVHVTHPRTVAQAADMIEELGRVVGAARAGGALAAQCRGALTLASARAGAHPRPRAFCPIWRNPWMTFRTETYVGSMLDAVGLENVFGERFVEGEKSAAYDAGTTTSGSGAGARAHVDRAASAESALVDRAGNERANDARASSDADVVADFFIVDIADALARAPDVIVLPDEPYVFGRKHGEELRALGAKAEIFYVDGKDLSWYGPRIPAALERLQKITHALSRI